MCKVDFFIKTVIQKLCNARAFNAQTPFWYLQKRRWVTTQNVKSIFRYNISSKQFPIFRYNISSKQLIFFRYEWETMFPCITCKLFLIFHASEVKGVQLNVNFFPWSLANLYEGRTFLYGIFLMIHSKYVVETCFFVLANINALSP